VLEGGFDLEHEVVQGWEREQRYLGLARGTLDKDFARGGLGALAVAPSVRIVVLPGDPSAQIVPPDDPKSVLPQVVAVGDVSLPVQSLVRGTSSGYVAYSPAREGDLWESFMALHSHGGVDFFLGNQGARLWQRPVEPALRVIYLKRSIAWAWGALELQRQMAERYATAGPFRVIVGVASTAGAALGDLGAGWAEPGSPYAFALPLAVEPQVLLFEDLPEWPDAEGIEALALRFGARLDLAFGGAGSRHLDHQGPNAGKFVAPR
jgi:hypothetical protein